MNVCIFLLRRSSSGTILTRAAQCETPHFLQLCPPKTTALLQSPLYCSVRLDSQSLKPLIADMMDLSAAEEPTQHITHSVYTIFMKVLL